MNQDLGKIRCKECGDFVPVDGPDDIVTCGCGQQIIVTITQMPNTSA
ncbi:hypothetical protein ACKVMT_17885 [Halobacteriales archaeon Cl-PHB]